MSVKKFSATGAKQAGAVKLPEAKLSDAGISRVIRVTVANERRQRPLAKTRAMVSGGGAKPWRQKGTGRARAGSNRSPLWRGGGVTFGPSGLRRPYKRIPRGMRRAAVLAALQKLADADRLSVVAGKLALTRSKAAADVVTKIVPEGTALFVVAKDERPQVLGIRNLDGVELLTVDDCTVYDLLRADQTVLTEAALAGLTTAPKVKTGRPTARSATKPAAKPAAKTGSAT